MLQEQVFKVLQEMSSPTKIGCGPVWQLGSVAILRSRAKGPQGPQQAWQEAGARKEVLALALMLSRGVQGTEPSLLHSLHGLKAAERLHAARALCYSPVICSQKRYPKLLIPQKSLTGTKRLI